MRTHLETAAPTPPELAGVHEPILELIGEVGGTLYDHLQAQFSNPLRIGGVLHGSTDSSRLRTADLRLIQKCEDARVPGYTDSWIERARIETWAGKAGLRGKEVEITLYCPDRTQSWGKYAPPIEERMLRTDTLGLDDRGGAFINAAHVALASPDELEETRPDWARLARADRTALCVAGTAIMAIQVGWPSLDPRFRGDSLDKLRDQFLGLGDMLNEPATITDPEQWYAPLAGVDFLQ